MAATKGKYFNGKYIDIHYNMWFWKYKKKFASYVLWNYILLIKSQNFSQNFIKLTISMKNIAYHLL